MKYDEPPIFTIDLSLPPVERYVEVALYFKDKIHNLTCLFDELVEDVLPNVSVKFVKGLARLALHRLHRSEENEEIRGISRATGVDMYLLVAFNVLLDCLMGCTSGACITKEPESPQTKLLHFRTLDWTMDELRGIVVQLNYVRSPSAEILASSVTYAGFVGVLTGVRRELSISLNFRPNHDKSSRLANFRFYSHLLLVLLGLRPSISSHLRQILFTRNVPSLASLEDTFPTTPTTSCYLTACSSTEAVTFEKDHRNAQLRSSTTFIVTTNHDVCTALATAKDSKKNVVSNMGLADMIEESTERRGAMLENWERKVRNARREARRRKNPKTRSAPDLTLYPNGRITRSRSKNINPDVTSESSSLAKSTSNATNSSSSADTDTEEDIQVTATKQEVIKWVLKWPTTNECTHFAAVLDPAEGKVAWVRRMIEPVESPDEEMPRREWTKEGRRKDVPDESSDHFSYTED
jgi:hypothetical protein